MASRFQIVDKKYIAELKDKSENENSKKVTEYWKKVSKRWTNERNFQEILEEYESDVLDQTLLRVYEFRNSVILPSMLLTSNHYLTWAISNF